MQISKQYVKFFIQSIIVLLYLNVHPTYAGQPTAHPGIGQAVQKNQLQANETALDGTQSSDPENETLTYQWYGPFGTAESAKPEVTIPQGIYTVTLIVSDGQQRSAPETATIAVNACFNINARAKRNKIQLTWDNQPEIQKYEIYRSDNTAPSTFRKIGETSSRYATYLDETVATDITYLYIVAAQIQTKNCYSEVASAHPSRERIYGQNYNSIIHSIPVVKAWAGIKFNYDVNGTDPNAQDNLKYTLTNAPVGMVIDPDNGQISWIPEQSGDVEVSVRVSDGKDGNDYQSFTLHVSELSQLNQSPKADAGEDQTAYMAEIVYLDASNSIDLDGDPLQYTWTILDKPQGSQVELSDAHLIKPLFTIDKQGLYRIQLTVNDGAEESTPDEVTISTINRKPVADAGQDQQGQVGNTLTLNGSNSSDEDNDPLTYQWTLTFRPQGSTATITSPGLQESSFTADISGKYVVQLIVNDGIINSEPAAVEIDITAIVVINNPPKITTTPVISNTVEALYSYTVAASDPDLGDKLTFSLDTAPAGMSIDPESGLISWTPENPGDFQIEVRVRDIAGLTDTQQYQLQINPVIVLSEPDLSISYIDNTDTIYDDQTNTVSGKLTVTIENDSETAVNDSFKVLIFEDRDADGLYQAGTDSRLGEATVSDGLNALASKTLNITLAGSVEFSGSLIWGFIDSQNTVAESDEANNINNSSYQCTYTPPVGQFDPVVEWNKSSFSFMPASNQVMMTPAVADLNGDKIPDIVFTTFSGSNYLSKGVLRAISGDDGRELWNVYQTDFPTSPGSSLAIGDIDNDNKIEVITVDSFIHVVVYEHDGALKWRSEVALGNAGSHIQGVTLADIDGDGTPEIIAGNTVFNHDGSVRWDGAAYDVNHFMGTPIVADLDIDGNPEIIMGQNVFRADGSLHWKADVLYEKTAVGNFDNDPYPEVVGVESRGVYLLEHTGELIWGPMQIPGGGGGHPTVADMDGDGELEIGVAGADYYAVFNTDGSILWNSKTRDHSSRSTGSSVFDFDGDGKAEVIYGDELKLRIYNGIDGTVLFEMAKGSGTLYELPVIVDVDNDGNAEIVAIANDYAFGNQTGIYVIGDANDTWVPTRQIWNQHSYHISNINDDGSIPTHEANSWETHNTYRLNSLPESASVFSAPDLIASSVNLSTNNDKIILSARIGNGGGIVVGEGIDIAFYDGNPASGGTLLRTTKTTTRIASGRYEDVQVTIPLITVTELWVSADDDGLGNGQVNECDELNNIYHSNTEFNRKPTITSSPILTVISGDNYQYDVEATDPNSDQLTYSLLQAPIGMTIDSITGLIEWTPDAVGSQQVAVRVQDVASLFDIQQYQLQVNPVIVLTEPDLSITNIDNSDTVYDGQSNTVSGKLTVTIENQSETTVNDSFKVLIFEDRDADGLYLPGIDSNLGETTVTDGLNAQTSKTISITLAGSVEFSGSLLWGFIDSQNVIAETDEVNNINNSSYQCTYTPPVGQFDPVVELHKDNFFVLPDSSNVMMTPTVIDLNEDQVPEIIFSTFTGGTYTQNGILRAIRGDNGEELWNVVAPEHKVDPSAGIAVGDIDLDGQPDIIAIQDFTITNSRRLIAFEHDGAFKWVSEAINEQTGWGGPAIADLDQDGIPEIIIGATVLNSDGSIRWEGSLLGGEGHANNQGQGFGLYGVQSVVTDLDLDGIPEVVAGKSAYRADGTLYWNANIKDGFPAVGNFDVDLFPELIIVSGGNLYLLQHDGSIGWGPVAIPGNRGGGAPTIADLDGDGQPEIGIAGTGQFTVVETDGTIKWQSETRDDSSMTGSSVFDFDADGSAEIVYGDEFFLRIYRGTDGAVLYELPKGSGTTYEIPIIADVDGDGNAEIVAVANNYAFGSQKGVFVIGDSNDTWVPTRKIWNQHSYHITNINDDGSIPEHEANSWETHNTYRLNSLPESTSVFSAPDLIASSVNLSTNNAQITLSARIGNGGGIVVGEGIDIAFYNGDPAAGGTLLTTTKTTIRITSGRYEDVQVTIPLIAISELWVSADDDGLGQGKVNECDELNNFYHNYADSANKPPRITSIPAPAISRLTISVANDENRSGWGVDNFSFSNSSAGIVDFEDIGLAEGGVLTNEVAGLTFQGAIIAAQGDPAYGFVSATGGDITNSGGNFFGNFVTDPVVDGSLSVSGIVEVLFEDDIFDLSFQVADIDGGETFNAKIFGPDNTLLDEIVFTVGSVNDFVTGDGDVTPIHFITPRAEVNQPYRYQVEAIDADVGDKLTFSLLSAPEGMAIDPNTGLIEWVPVNDQSGAQVVSVKVQDSVGLFDTQEYQVLVQVDNICRASIPSNLAPLLAYQFDDQNNPTENVGSLGADYDAQLSGDASFTSFESGKAIAFDGAYDYVIPGGDANLLNIADDDFSLVATIQTTTFEPEVATDSIRSIIWKEGTGSNSMYVLGLRRKIGTARFALADGLNSISIEGNIPINDDRPHKLIAARSGDDLYLCVDGQLDGMTALPIGFGSTINNSQLVIGGRTIADSGGSPTTGNNDDFNGIIDDVFIFSQSIIGSTDNAAPFITSTPVKVVFEGQVYNYDVEATDPDLNDNLTYLLTTAPDGMTIDTVAGLIEWGPTSVHIGNHEVTVSVTDIQGNSDSQSFTVNVSALQEQIAISPPGFIASTCASGDLLDRPIGIRFGPDANLYVANSRGAISGNSTPPEDNIIKIDSAGTQAVFSWGEIVRGAYDLDFNLNQEFHTTTGSLFFSLEDTTETGVSSLDLIAKVSANGGKALEFSAISDENYGVRFGAGGEFGHNLYVAARLEKQGESRLFQVDSSGNRSLVLVNDGVAEITGAVNIIFGPGGEFGNDLYLSTDDFLGAPFLSNSSDAIYRVNSSGLATLLTTGKSARFMAFSPDVNGHFGEYLYVANSSDGSIYRVDSEGNESLFASGFITPTGLDFGPDGNLCVADAGTGDIIRISPNSANNFAPLITSTAITDAQVGTPYSYDVEAIDLDDDNLSYQLNGSLFGATHTENGVSTLVQIDPDTGITTELFEFDIPEGFIVAGLTFHEPSSQFLISVRKAGARETKLGILDPQSQQISIYDLKGLPSQEYLVEGITYRASTNQILITLGNNGQPSDSDQIGEIDIQGNVLQISESLGLGDRDHILENPNNGNLLVLDWNGTSPRIAGVSDPFGVLNTTVRTPDPITYNINIIN